LTCSAVDPHRRRRRRPLHAAVPPLAAAALLLGGCASGGGVTAPGPPESALQVESLINLRLSPEHSQWLIGPVAVLASAEEEGAFLALTDDAEAEAFVDDFWQRRDPYPDRPDNPLRDTFEQRAQVADRLYSEGGRQGSHTARGTIYVLFGKPPRTDYEIASDPRDPPIEIWFYDGEREPGLGGEPPAPYYRFIKRGEVTEFYRPRTGIERARPVRPEEL
jgi:GWxTD domain-containing protein